MNETLYKILACDLDGTLVDENLVITPQLRHAFDALQEAGITPVIATGRGFESALPFARELGVTAPIICYQGGRIQSPQNGNILRDVTFSSALLHEIAPLAEKEKWELVVYQGDATYVIHKYHDDDFYARWFGLPIHTITSWDELPGEPSKFIVVDEDPQRIQQIWIRLRGLLQGRMEIVRSHTFFVEGNPYGVSKGAALAWLCNQWQIPRELVVAVGDNENDASMIAWAGLGIAMGNASREAKIVADLIAPPVQEQGILWVIERLLRG